MSIMTIPASLAIMAVTGAVGFIGASDGLIPSKGAEFSNSIERALSQSQDSGEALNDMAESEVFQEIFGPAGSGGLQQAPGATTDGQGTPMPEATLTPEQKLDLQAAGLQTGAPTQLQIDAREIQAQWSPRYQGAKEEYELLVRRVEATAKYAEDYFTIQNDRINEIQTSQPGAAELRANLSRVLRSQMVLYADWSAQARSIRDQMAVIMVQLDNMNLAIEFMSDAADFDAISRAGLEAPHNIIMLQGELPRFQEMTLELAGKLESQR